MSSHLFDPTFLLGHLQTVSGDTVNSYDAVSKVLTIVYQCSLYKEESRDVRCRVIIVQGPANEYQFDLLRFVQPVPLSVATLRRLSFATVDPDSVIIVDCRETEPSVIGFGTVATTFTYLCALEIYERPYEVACLAPGVIEMSANKTTVRFVRDRYVIPKLHQAVSCAIPSASVTKMVERVAFPGMYGLMNYSKGWSVGLPDLERFRLHHATFQAQAPGPARWALSNYAISLAKEIRRIGVGGSVLILPSLEATEVEALMSGYAVAESHERYRGELWNAGLLNMFEWMLHWRMAYLDKMVLYRDAEAQTPQEWIDTEGKGGMSKAEGIANDDATRVARLSAIDGALVVNCLFRPMIFGAKFRKVDTTALPVPVQVALSTSGMRHRSIAATVGAIPESGGIVVSQDGDITIFTNVNNAVCCHHEEHGLDGTVSSAECRHVCLGEDARIPYWFLDLLSDGEMSREQ